MHLLSKNTLVFVVAFLFLTSVSAEELIHEHHDHHDHISSEINCDFCTKVTPEFDNKIVTFDNLCFSAYDLIDQADNQILENNTFQFFSRGPPTI